MPPVGPSRRLQYDNGGLIGGCHRGTALYVARPQDVSASTILGEELPVGIEAVGTGGAALTNRVGLTGELNGAAARCAGGIRVRSEVHRAGGSVRRTAGSCRKPARKTNGLRRAVLSAGGEGEQTRRLRRRQRRGGATQDVVARTRGLSDGERLTCDGQRAGSDIRRRVVVCDEVDATGSTGAAARNVQPGGAVRGRSPVAGPAGAVMLTEPEPPPYGTVELLEPSTYVQTVPA